MENPKVTIVMPTYNRVALLQRALKSIFEQSFADWELIIIDDMSTDGTGEVLREAESRDSRIRVIRNMKSTYAVSGIVGPLNQGLALARGVYIARLDDDDRWIDREKLAKQVDFLDHHSEYVVVGGGVIVVDMEGREYYRYLKRETDEEIRKTALMANPFSHTTVMFRADIARACGGYRARYAEDWDLWLSMGARGKLYNFQEYFMAYTMSGKNVSFVHQRAMSRTILGFITRHRKLYPNFLKAYALNLVQYGYSFLPIFVRRFFHNKLSAMKRSL